MRIAAHGLAIDAPRGWDARISRRGREVASATQGRAGSQPTLHPVLHAANFALPEARGDFGSGAVELMSSPHALVALLEFHPDAARTPLFSDPGMPRRLSLGDFSPQQLQRTLRGQAGAQRFFSEAGRAFCLYVVLGGFANRNALVPQVNATLERMEIGGG
jgi:hypothetical protein